MIKLCAIVSAILLSSICAFSQTTFNEMSGDLNKTGGVYYAYPSAIADNSPAPKGFKPFYISHYGRHGSRYLISDHDTKWVLDLFNKAHDANALTMKGEAVRHKLDSIWIEVQGKGGDLSPLGTLQHKSIANRMFQNYPDVFAGDGKISARSTLVVRCVLSMAAFCESLKENNPKLNIYRESSQKYMPYLCYSTPESDQFNGKDGWVQLMLQKFRGSHVNGDRMVSELFSDKEFVDRYVNPVELMWGMYWIASDAQNTEGKISLYEYFTPEELFNMWQCFNADFYSRHANFRPADGKHLNNAKPLLRNFIDGAEAAINGNGEVATLRFGHDGNVVPFVALLGFDECAGSTSKPEDFYKTWCDWKVSPMAANIQMILYHDPKKPEKGILVKFLHNEKETHIPVQTDIWPYYQWSDVKSYYENLLSSK